MCLRTNALNSKKIGEGFFLKYFILIFIHQTTTMDFRPREALFFGDNFFKLATIGFTFSHHPFQPKRRYPSIWSLNKISKFRVPVIDP